MPTGPADMFVHVSCSGLAVGEPYVRAEGGSFACSTRRRDLNVLPARNLHQVPQGVKTATIGASAPGMAVTPSVLCETLSRIRSTPWRSNRPTASGALLHERVDPERQHAWNWCSHLQRRLSVQYHHVGGSNWTWSPASSLVGSRNNIMPSMPVIDLLRSTSTCCSSATWHAGHAVISHMLRPGSTREGRGLRHCGAAEMAQAWVKTKICRSVSIGAENESKTIGGHGLGLVWSGSGKTWLDNT
jgi:hypothetical protein